MEGRRFWWDLCNWR